MLAPSRAVRSKPNIKSRIKKHEPLNRGAHNRKTQEIGRDMMQTATHPPCHAEDLGSIPGGGIFYTGHHQANVDVDRDFLGIGLTAQSALPCNNPTGYSFPDWRMIINHIRSIACRDLGSNRGPSDLQPDTLPTELSRLVVALVLYLCIYIYIY